MVNRRPLREAEVSQLRLRESSSSSFLRAVFPGVLMGSHRIIHTLALQPQPTCPVPGSWLAGGQACTTVANDADTALVLRRHS